VRGPDANQQHRKREPSPLQATSGLDIHDEAQFDAVVFVGDLPTAADGKLDYAKHRPATEVLVVSIRGA